MEIKILHLLDGAKSAEGLTVVIDVFRAFSLACYLTDKGVAKIIPVSDINLAYSLKKEIPGSILVGERNERVPEGFDYGNSPTHVLHADIAGKTVIHTTSAGTQGLVNATKASERITGSFVNAPAIVQYIKMKNPKIVSLVCMGYSMKYPTEEDTFCAEYIKQRLEGEIPDTAAMMETIKNTSAQRLFNPDNQDFSPSSDFYHCTQIGKFNFVLKAEETNDLLVLKKIDSKDF
ncbi:MAG TPA: 2-phosphosulfolactate phosphatase [Bacteroidales bacterium]|nr:2-phosphosulfolactate phosphatase [Bacteroidales bacterium]